MAAAPADATTPMAAKPTVPWQDLKAVFNTGEEIPLTQLSPEIQEELRELMENNDSFFKRVCPGGKHKPPPGRVTLGKATLRDLGALSDLISLSAFLPAPCLRGYRRGTLPAGLAACLPACLLPAWTSGYLPVCLRGWLSACLRACLPASPRAQVAACLCLPACLPAAFSCLPACLRACVPLRSGKISHDLLSHLREGRLHRSATTSGLRIFADRASTSRSTGTLGRRRSWSIRDLSHASDTS